MLKYFFFILFVLGSLSFGDEIDDEFGDGFEDEFSEEIVVEDVLKKDYYFLGNIEQKVHYATHNRAPHNDLNSLKTALYLESEYSFNENHKIRMSANGFYDFIYDIYSDRTYSQQEKDEFKYQAEIFDLYIQGKLSPNFDYKVGRQIVIWGRSDTIRVTDILNPLDNRTPGVVDIEDLRLPVGMLKFDYYLGDWNANVIIVAETRYSKNPVYGSDFYPFPFLPPANKKEKKPAIALSLSGTFSSWDISLYSAKTTSDEGHLEVLLGKPTIIHEDVYMLGYAFNFIHDNWLFKTEGAFFDGYKFTLTGNQTFKELNALVGVEYNGINETVMAFELANKHIFNYDNILNSEVLPVLEDTTQYAFRINSDFFNATLHANYLISLFGKDMRDGGFSRVWFDYDVNDNLSTELGYVDYLGGSKLFDILHDNDMLFGSLKYSF